MVRAAPPVPEVQAVRCGPGFWMAMPCDVSVSRLAHVDTAFAMTVHKSQGSEFAHTVLVMAPGAGGVMTRELVYTGITRARTHFSLVEGEPGLLATAIRQRVVRASGLQARLGL